MPKNTKDTSAMSKDEAIANYKIAGLKQAHKYQLLIVAILFTAIGMVGGYFVSINITSDMRANVISELQATALKEK